MKIIEDGYPSLNAMVHASLGPSAMPLIGRASRDESAHSNFWMGATWHEARDLARTGDIAGARRLAPALLEAINATTANRPRLDPEYRLDGGCAIDIARYVKGEPECWLEMIELEPMPQRGIAIVVNVAVLGNVKPSAIDKVGVGIGGAILGIQSQGCAVTLFVARYSADCNSGSYRLLQYAPINPGGTPLDISQMSAVLRPWFLRRILFSLQETHSAETRERFSVGDGYGYSRSMGDAEARIVAKGYSSPIVINVCDAINNPSQIQRGILDQLKKGTD